MRPRWFIVLGIGVLVVAGAGKFAISQIAASLDRNVAYCGTTSKQQTLDVYRASHALVSPYVVYVHGGGWRRGDKINDLSKTYAPYFNKKGITFVSVNYRLSPVATYPQPNQDVACALSFLASHGSRFGIDPARSIYFGDSAGAELASYAALKIPYGSYDYPAPKGVIDFYGVSDFTTIVSGAHVDKNARFYLGSKYNSLASKASPVAYVTVKAPRFLFIHGQRDSVVPYSQTTTINTTLQKYGVDTELVTLSNVGHAFVGPELSPSHYAQITSALDSFVKETL